MLPFFKPASLQFIIPDLEELFDMCRIFSFIVIVVIYLYNRKYSKLIFTLILYQGILLFSTALHHGDYWRLAVNSGTVISFTMITEIVLKQNPKLFFRSILLVYSVLIPADFILYLIYPNGLVRSSGHTFHFLETRNSFAHFFIPIIVCLCIYAAYYNHKFTFLSLFTILCGSARLVMTWSATGVVSLMIIVIYIGLIYKSNYGRFLDICKYYIAFLICQIGFVFIRVQKYFSYIIEVLLKKSLTFTGRTEIWDLSFRLIKKSPILGYGVYEGSGLIWWNNGYYYSHNGILEVLLQGGVVALIVFIILFIIAALPLYKYRTHYISGIISTGIFSVLVIMLAEAQITSIWLFGLLNIATCTPQIIEQIEKEKRKGYKYNERITQNFYYYSDL